MNDTIALYHDFLRLTGDPWHAIDWEALST